MLLHAWLSLSLCELRVGLLDTAEAEDSLDKLF